MRSIIDNKRGTGWTVSKLVSLILLAVVLVMVIVGVYSKALDPLIKKVKDAWNWIFALFGKGGGDVSGDGLKKEVDIKDVGKGELEIQAKDNFLECKVTLTKPNSTYSGYKGESYRLNYAENGRLEKWDGSAFKSVEEEIYSENRIWLREVYQAFLKKVVTEKFKMSFDGKEYPLSLGEYGLVADLGSAGKYAFGKGFLGDDKFNTGNIVLWYYSENEWVKAASRQDLDEASYSRSMLLGDKDIEWKKKLYFAFLDYTNRKWSSDFSLNFEVTKNLFLKDSLIKVNTGYQSKVIVYSKLTDYFYGFDYQSNFYSKLNEADAWVKIEDDIILAPQSRVDKQKFYSLIKSFLQEECGKYI